MGCVNRVRMPLQLATPPGLVVGPLDPGEQQSEQLVPVLVDVGVRKIEVESLVAGCRIVIDVHRFGNGRTGERSNTDGRHTALIRVTCDHAAMGEVMKGDSRSHWGRIFLFVVFSRGQLCTTHCRGCKRSVRRFDSHLLLRWQLSFSL